MLPPHNFLTLATWVWWNIFYFRVVWSCTRNSKFGKPLLPRRVCNGCRKVPPVTLLVEICQMVSVLTFLEARIIFGAVARNSKHVFLALIVYWLIPGRTLTSLLIPHTPDKKTLMKSLRGLLAATTWPFINHHIPSRLWMLHCGTGRPWDHWVSVQLLGELFPSWNHCLTYFKTLRDERATKNRGKLARLSLGRSVARD